MTGHCLPLCSLPPPSTLKSPHKASKIALYLQTPASATAGSCSSFSPSDTGAAAHRGPLTAGSWRQARAQQQDS